MEIQCVCVYYPCVRMCACVCGACAYVVRVCVHGACVRTWCVCAFVVRVCMRVCMRVCTYM